MVYDDRNIFARILKGEIPCNKVYENEYALAFEDIRPQAPVHVLVIPKGPYITLHDMTDQAPHGFVGGFWKAVAETAKLLGLPPKGYRILANSGEHAHQEVPHFHVHIFAGRPLGPMLKRPD
jgi:diadenosine tetraphosphate (Ap4A) HIT family hydrolase